MGIFSCGNAYSYMSTYGYGTVALPRVGIGPLQMLAKSGGRLTPIGPLTGTFRAGAAPVPVAARNKSSNISGSRSSGADVSIGIDILGTVIGALSGSSLGIKAAYKNAKTVAFEFGDVWENLVDINALDQFLSTATVAGNAGNFLKELLEDDEVYCIYSTIDALQVSVEATGQNNASLGLDVPTIQQLVGGKVAVASNGASTSKITYTSTELPLAFGIKVVRLIVDSGRYTTMKFIKAKDSNLAAALIDDGGAAPGDVATFTLDLEP